MTFIFKQSINITKTIFVAKIQTHDSGTCTFGVSVLVFKTFLTAIINYLQLTINNYYLKKEKM